ncbi:MAG: hypothetical protein K0Q72_2032 [Armatimonadetes bacterium]|nr:hypothetical protein [Armatimonadota bacterium]
MPEAAAVGATMPLTLTIRNEGDRPFTVRSLAARGTTLRAFRLEKPVPAPTRGTLNVWGSTVWSYEQPVEPGKSWSVRFDATPLKSGTVRGVVEAQVNTGMRSAPFTIEVEHQAGKEPAKSPPPAIRR